MGRLITEVGTQARPDVARDTQTIANRGFGFGQNKWVADPPRYFVNIFTVSKREFHVSHALIPSMDIAACAPEERWKKVAFIPSPFAQSVPDVFSTGDSPFRYHRAERVAQDICNPSNPTENQDYETTDQFFRIQDGTNLSHHGLFWSLNNEPTEEELQKAEARRNKFLEYVLQTADKFNTENPSKLTENLTLAGLTMADVRAACDIFFEERPYYQKPKLRTSCPNCGEKIKAGVAFHKDEDGDLCILDWKRTVESGKRKKEDVPDDKRWWTDEAPKAKAKSAAPKFDDEI